MKAGKDRVVKHLIIKTEKNNGCLKAKTKKLDNLHTSLSHSLSKVAPLKKNLKG